MRAGASAVAWTLFASGCFVVDDAHLAELRRAGADASGLDAGGRSDAAADATPGGDAADARMPVESLPVDDMCGVDPPAMTLTGTIEHARIVTTGLSNFVSSSCGSEAAVGNDAFLALDVQAGEYWHFHLSVDPSDPGSVEGRPALYLLNVPPGGSCDARDCRFSSDVCDGSGDEHFGFVADASGRWYLGIDDRDTGGGRYLLDVIRPVCGDGVPEHGEACDDANGSDGDGCTRRCTWELSAESGAEIEPNDNTTEANFLVIGADGTFTVDGAVGGSGVCRYPDYFAIDVPMNATLEVDPLNPDGTICSDPALTAGYVLGIYNPANVQVVEGMTNGTGCATVRTPRLAGGLYYLGVKIPEELARAVRYRLAVRVVR